MVHCDWSGREDEIQEAEESVEGMIEHVEDPIKLILQQSVLNDIRVYHSPVENGHKQGNVDRDRLYNPGNLHVTVKSIGDTHRKMFQTYKHI